MQFERYTPQVVAANATVNFNSSAVGNFLAVTAGTITIVANAADGKEETTILNAFPVAAGADYDIRLFVGKNGGRVVAAGGASGTLGTN